MFRVFIKLLNIPQVTESGVSMTTWVGIVTAVVCTLVILFVVYTRWNRQQMQRRYAAHLQPDENFQVGGEGGLVGGGLRGEVR